MYSKQLPVTFLIVIAALLFAACTPSEPAESPTPTLTEPVLSDCFWSATAVAFQDANENGIRDEGEMPIEDIQFILDPTVYSRTTSGPDGIANIFATTPTAGTTTSCDELATQYPLSVSAVKFDGYQLTTPQTLPYTNSEVEYHFGFKPNIAIQPEGQGQPETSLLESGTAGYLLSPNWPVAQVNYLFEWYGENVPVWEYEQLTAQDGRFIHGSGQDVTGEVQNLISSINFLTPADQLQYTNLWTDDYPEWHVELRGQDGRSILLYSESTGFRGHAPWYVEVDGRLYRQTTGDIGFALYNLTSDHAHDYFSLEEPAFDESLLEPGGRPFIYDKLTNFTGLLPIAKTFEYDYFYPEIVLTGLFYWNSQHLEYDTSSQPLVGIEAIQLIQPGGEAQPCTFESGPDPEFPELTLWTFRCPYSSDTFQILTIQITFTTAGNTTLTIEGTLLPPPR